MHNLSSNKSIIYPTATKPSSSSKTSGFQPQYTLNTYVLCQKKAKTDPSFKSSPVWNTVMDGKCFVHRIGTKFSGKSINISYLPVSKAFPNNARNVLQLLESCAIDIDDKWVSLPAYAKDENIFQVNDFQLATTGTKSSEEEYSDTSKRECGEENGINVEDENVIQHAVLPHHSKHVEAFVYYVSSIGPAKPIPPVSKESENSSQKIMSWVIFDDPSEISNRSRINDESSGDIAGLLSVVMRVSDLKNLIFLCF